VIDQYLQVLDEAQAEAQLGTDGVVIAKSMLRALAREFPAHYRIPGLVALIADPTVTDWTRARQEVIDAAGAMLGAHQQAEADRKAQTKAAASKPRSSKWDAFREALAGDLAAVDVTDDDRADVMEAELQALWRGRGLIETPPRSTVIKWLRAR
jgi:hypothetical protein